VGDHADHALALGQGLERRRHHVEGLAVQGAEALVEEDGVQARSPRRGERGDLRRQRKGERKRRLEGLTARQGTHRPAGVGVGVIDHEELPGVVGQVELAAGQARHRHPRPAFDEDDRVNQVRYDPRQYAAREILLGILSAEGVTLSATETITTAQEEAGSLAILVPRYLHAAHLDADTRYRAAAAGVLGSDTGSGLVADPAWGAVVRRLYNAETNGWEPDRLLATVAAQRELHTADSVAEVIAWRIDGFLTANPEPPTLGPGVAPAAPAAATRPADGPTPAPGCQPYENAAAARDRLAAMAAETLGPHLAGRARSETAWPALLAGLRRAETAGHDPAVALSSVIAARELRTARSISEVLAWRIGRQLAATSVPDRAADPAEATAAGSAPASSVPADPLPWVAKPLDGSGGPRKCAAGQIPERRRRADHRPHQRTSRHRRPAPPPVDEPPRPAARQPRTRT
jgi:hypothetical protein